MKMGNAKDFYVGILNPKEVRRNVLEASKEFVQALQRYEKVKEIRENKQKAILELKSELAEVSNAIAALRTALPDYKMSELPRKREEKKEKVAVSKIIMLPRPKKKKTMPKKVKKTKLIKPKKVKKAAKQKEAIKSNKKADIDRLQKELSTIESKLRGL